MDEYGLTLRLQRLQREIQQQHVHPRLAEQAELPAFGVSGTPVPGLCPGSPHGPAPPGPPVPPRWPARCGDRAPSRTPSPCPTECGPARPRPPAPPAPPAPAISVSASLRSVGPLLVPAEAVASYPAPAADGRGWKYSGRVKLWPISALPTSRPFTLDDRAVGLPGKEQLRERRSRRRGRPSR